MNAQAVLRPEGGAGRADFEAMCHSRLQESVSALEQTVARLDPVAMEQAVN